jgi:hypothetical protein
MKRLLSSGLVFVAGIAILPGGVSPLQSQKHPAPDYRNDPRLDTLTQFFQEADCPAAEYSDVFLEAADDYDLDWRLLPSISYVESTGGKAAPHNNIFGWDSGRAEFASVQAGIHEVGYRLTHSSLYKNKTLDALLATYNPNTTYATKVKSVMRRISPFE